MLAAPDTERTTSDRENSSNGTGGELESQPTDDRIQAARGANDSSQRMDNGEVLQNSFWCSQFWVACWAEVVGLVCAATTELLCLAPAADSLPFFLTRVMERLTVRPTGSITGRSPGRETPKWQWSEAAAERSDRQRG